MSVTYSGNTAWEIRKTPLWSGGGYDLDSVRVWWQGNRPGYIAFINSINRFGDMPGFPGMHLQTFQSVEDRPSFPAVEFTFTGTKKDELPPVHAVDGKSFQSAQGSGRDTAQQREVSGTINYIASRTTYTWFENKEPADQPRYAVVRKPSPPLAPENIVSYSMVNEDDGRRVNNIPYSQFVAVLNSLVVRNVVSDYRIDQIVPGKIWACSADIDYKVV